MHCLLSCALRILSDKLLVTEFWADADILLKKFVSKSSEIFGQCFNVFNVHNMSHIAAECALHGSLDDFSAWKYESYLGQLKNLLHAPGKALEQIVCRLMERIAILPEREAPVTGPLLEQPHCRGPLLTKGEQYQKLTVSGITLRISVNDACFVTHNNQIVMLRNIVKTQGGIEVLGNEFKLTSPYFTYPISSDVLGIRKVAELGSLKRWPISQIKQKAVLLPLTEPVPRNPSCHWMDNIECLCLPMLQNVH